MATKYRESIKAQRVAIQFEAQMRGARVGKTRARAMMRRRTKMEQFEETEVARMEVERGPQWRGRTLAQRGELTWRGFALAQMPYN